MAVLAIIKVVVHSFSLKLHFESFLKEFMTYLDILGHILPARVCEEVSKVVPAQIDGGAAQKGYRANLDNSLFSAHFYQLESVLLHRNIL